MRLFLAALSLVSSANAFALTDQINAINNYLYQRGNIVVDKTNTYNLPGTPYAFSGKDLKKGDSSEFIKTLQEKYNLPITGVYDNQLLSIVKEKQKDSGLNPNGIIDKTTWLKVYGIPADELNTLSIESLSGWNDILAKQAYSNSNYMVVVNIPSMRLFLYQKNGADYSKVMESKVIIGRTITPTPQNDFEIVSIKYNPTWTPTTNMLKRNVYKKDGVNVDWLKSHHLKVYDNEGNERDYSELSTIREPRFVQELGDGNALGNLKFETNSSQDIYLHDTNERHLFAKNIRTYSSGCVRVEEYKDLAAILLKKDTEHINKNIEKRQTIYERPSVKVPVYFDYSQIISNKNGIWVFPDIYKQKEGRS